MLKALRVCRVRPTKLKLLVLFGLASFSYLFYQIIIYSSLLPAYSFDRDNVIELVHGTHLMQKPFYEPDKDNMFRCIHSMELITFDKVNDDYCDCDDGTDEPGTNACPNGIFYCMRQVSFGKYKKSISSMKVNDGICDCCDGSDEWKGVKLPFNVDRSEQRRLGKYLNPCPHLLKCFLNA